MSSMLRVASSAICRHTGLAVQQGVRLTNSRVTRHIAAGTNMQSSDTAADPQPGMRQQPDPLPISCAPRAKAVLEYWWVFQCMCAVAACSCSMYHRHLASSVMCHGECRRFGEAFVSAPFGYMPEQRYFGLWYKGGPDVDAEIKQVCAKADVPRKNAHKLQGCHHNLCAACKDSGPVPFCRPEHMLCATAALRQRFEGAGGRQAATVGPTLRAAGLHPACRPVHEVTNPVCLVLVIDAMCVQHTAIPAALAYSW